MASDKPLQILTERGARPVDVLPQFESRGNAPDQQACVFASACLGKARPACSGEEGVVVMKVIDAAYQSSRLNREVAIRV
jgi:predicted dehydrogenase